MTAFYIRSKEKRRLTNTVAEVEALLDDFEQQVKSSALEEAIREMKEGSASDSDSTDNEEEDENEAMSEDERPADDGNMDVDDEERIPDTKSEDKPSTFRDRYMGKVTQAFSTDLDKIRQVSIIMINRISLLSTKLTTMTSRNRTLMRHN